MAATVRLTIQPEEAVIEVAAGTRLFDAALQGRFTITSDCGGHGECGKCFVRIQDDPGEPGDLDRRMLSEDRLARGARLACAYPLRQDTTVYIPPGKRRQNRFE
jgi:Na+-transporting NADH:ubiquinone oxidoreductase subunit NqrF